MANEIKTDSPTIGERAVATVTEGVKQGLAGLVIGGAAGAALGGLASYLMDALKDVGVSSITDPNGLVLQLTPDQLKNYLGSGEAVKDVVTKAIDAAKNAGALSEDGAKQALGAIAGFVKDAQPDADKAKTLIETLSNIGVGEVSSKVVAGSAVVGATLGGAAGGAKGALEGAAYGNPTKWAERVAAKGTERGLENIMKKAMKEQQDFVAQVEAERKQQGSAPPTLAV